MKRYPTLQDLTPALPLIMRILGGLRPPSSDAYHTIYPSDSVYYWSAWRQWLPSQGASAAQITALQKLVWDDPAIAMLRMDGKPLSELLWVLLEEALGGEEQVQQALEAFRQQKGDAR